MGDDNVKCNWHGCGMVEGDRGWSCPACPNPNVLDTLRSALARLRDDAVRMARALDGTGPNLGPLHLGIIAADALLAAATPQEDDCE